MPISPLDRRQSPNEHPMTCANGGHGDGEDAEKKY